jgi:hypothetical protein
LSLGKRDERQVNQRFPQDLVFPISTKGIRFSKDPRTHKIVVALAINFWFFQRMFGEQLL